MGRHPASKIHAWRTSGVNAPGYSRPPAPPQPVPQAPQSPPDEYADERIDMAKLARDRYIAMRAAEAQDARLVAVAPVPDHVPGVLVYVGDVPHRIPAAWRVRVDRASDGGYMLFAIDAADRLRIMTNARTGLVELVDVPRDITAEIRADRFPGRPS